MKKVIYNVRLEYYDADDINCADYYTVDVVAFNEKCAICKATEYFLSAHPDQQASYIYNVEVDVDTRPRY